MDNSWILVTRHTTQDEDKQNQNTTQHIKLKRWGTRTPLKTGVTLCAPATLIVLTDVNLVIMQHRLLHSTTRVFFILYNNMKQARPWMLANLKIIWQFHAHQVNQKVSRFVEPWYIGDDFFFRAESSLIQSNVVPYEISKVNFRVET